MAVFRLPHAPIFPDPGLAEPDGLLAVGGDLSPERLLRAYAEGIFPWYSEETPILWWSPEPRMVLLPEELHVPRSLRRTRPNSRAAVTTTKNVPLTVVCICGSVKNVASWIVTTHGRSARSGMV